jgi:hypothetical protein
MKLLLIPWIMECGVVCKSRVLYMLFRDGCEEPSKVLEVVLDILE